MGGKTGGAGNVNCFEENIKLKRIPNSVSLPYIGFFNDNLFSINSKETQKLLSLDINYGIVNNPIDEKLDKEIYLATMIKSKFDGIGARKPIDMVIILDISGSMSSTLGSSTDSCLSLAKQAILKLKYKLTTEDQLGLCTFDDLGYVIFPLSDISNIENFENRVNMIQTKGGTNLHAGLVTGYKLFNLPSPREKRMVYLTDMRSINDKAFLNLLKQASEEGIYTTIIGIGSNFNSEFTELCSKNRGSNYFSATEESHLNKIIVEQFEYNFFPVAYDVNLEFRSGDFILKKAIGTGYKSVESSVSEYWKTSTHAMSNSNFKNVVNFILLYFNRINKRLPKAVLANFNNYLRYNKKTISEINTIYSCVINENNQNGLPVIQMEGGLVLLKLQPESQNLVGLRKGMVTLNYKDLYGKSFVDNYHFSIDMDKIGKGLDLENLNYFSGHGVAEGVAFYFYAKFKRRICKIKNNEYKIKKHQDGYLTNENLTKLQKNLSQFIQKYLSNPLSYVKLLEKLNEFVEIAVEDDKKV